MEDLVTAPTPLDKRWLTEAVRLREEHAGPLEDQEANRYARQLVATWPRASKHVRCSWPSAMT